MTQRAEKPQTIGIWMTSAIVVGTIIGSGIFMLPVALAPLGANSLIAWLISWAVLHFRWREREIAPRRISGIIGVLIALGVLGTFPPLWNVF